MEGCLINTEPILKRNGLFCFMPYDLRFTVKEMLYALPARRSLGVGRRHALWFFTDTENGHACLPVGRDTF
jgi:hypothetical protein